MAAALLLCSTCFGAMGMGFVLPGQTGDAVVPFFLLVGLVGVFGLLLGLVALIGRIVRRVTRRSGDTPGAEGPRADQAQASAALGRPAAPHATLLFLAGTLLFLSTCFGVASTASGRSGVSAIPAALLVAGMLVTLAGFGGLVMRVLAAWRRPPAAGGPAADATPARSTPSDRTPTS